MRGIWIGIALTVLAAVLNVEFKVTSVQFFFAFGVAGGIAIRQLMGREQ